MVHATQEEEEEEEEVTRSIEISRQNQLLTNSKAFVPLQMS